MTIARDHRINRVHRLFLRIALAPFWELKD